MKPKFGTSPPPPPIWNTAPLCSRLFITKYETVTEVNFITIRPNLLCWIPNKCERDCISKAYSFYSAGIPGGCF